MESQGSLKLNTRWKMVVAWCRLCWWRRSNEYHVTASDATVHSDLQKTHDKENKNCLGELRFESHESTGRLRRPK